MEGEPHQLLSQCFYSFFEFLIQNSPECFINWMETRKKCFRCFLENSRKKITNKATMTTFLQCFFLRWLDWIFEWRHPSTLSDQSTTLMNPTENRTLLVCRRKIKVSNGPGTFYQDLSCHSNERTP